MKLSPDLTVVDHLLSVRFSSRQGMKQLMQIKLRDHIIIFQSAFRRGKEWNFRCGVRCPLQHRLSVRFSSRQGMKLHEIVSYGCALLDFQSAFRRGKEWNSSRTLVLSSYGSLSVRFSSRQGMKLIRSLVMGVGRIGLSVRFSSRQGMKPRQSLKSCQHSIWSNVNIRAMFLQFAKFFRKYPPVFRRKSIFGLSDIFFAYWDSPNPRYDWIKVFSFPLFYPQNVR